MRSSEELGRSPTPGLLPIIEASSVHLNSQPGEN